MATETSNPDGATATISELQTPNKTVASTTHDASAPESENLATAVPPASGEPINAASKAKEPANDIEKKIRRSERFGVPLQLSEQEKRNSRAERFGTVSRSGALNSSEELKRKSRAERFGLEANSAVDSEEKKKARLARFGSNTKTDSQEEEKRKARALRFARSPADSRTYSNCKGTIELATKEAAVIGSATGGT